MMYMVCIEFKGEYHKPIYRLISIRDKRIKYPSIPLGNMQGGRGMNFQELRQRLIAELRERVRSGEVTERGLARMIGLSQPHMHNVLKGKRLFSLETTDEILRQLGLEVLDLIEPGELLDWSRR